MYIRNGFAGLICLFILVFTIAQAAPPAPAKPASRTIVYCDDYDYPPFTMFDSDGEPTGFNVELIRAVGREVGIEVDVRLKPWMQVLRALEERKADVSTMFYSVEYTRGIDFAVPLVTVIHEIFQRKGAPRLSSLDDLRGKEVLVEDGTYPAEYLRAYSPEIRVIAVESEPEALRLLAAGKGDAVLANQAVGRYTIARANLTNVVAAELPLLPINFSYVTIAGRPELLREINRGLVRVMRSGEYARLYSRWFGTHPPGIGSGISWRYLTAAGVLILLLTAGVLIWVWILRRQVAEKTQRLRGELEERERVEKQLRHSEAKLKGILDHSTAVIFVKDLQGRYTLVNRIFAEVIGKETSEVIGRTDSDLFSPELALKLADNDRRVLAAGAPMKFEEYHEHKGERRTFVTVKFPIRDPSGVIQALAGISMDISDRKRTEMEIQGARTAAERASQAKDHFLAVLSHELRTPLTPVLAAVAEALSTHLPEEQRAMLQMIQRNIEFESRLIEDLLDLTRLARGKLTLNFQTCNAHELMREAAAICSPGLAAKKQDLRFELNARHPYVRGDPARLQQVFWNVLQNATKFSPAGSEVRLSSFDTDDGRVAFQCTDQGVGMERKVLEQIFRPFEQVETAISRRHGGLGLGLSIAHMIIEAHHGEITANSEGPGKGSVFTITLPTVPAPETPARPPTPETVKESAASLRILLVEDSEDTRRVLAKLLKGKGHHVETAESVAAAKQLWSQHKFDLLLSDIGLPDASGLELASDLRSAGPLRAIAFSGFGSAEDIRKSKEAGFAEHLVKPLDINLLKQALTDVMNESPASPRE